VRAGAEGHVPVDRTVEVGGARIRKFYLVFVMTKKPPSVKSPLSAQKRVTVPVLVQSVEGVSVDVTSQLRHILPRPAELVAAARFDRLT
jgi:hypothetical protein